MTITKAEQEAAYQSLRKGVMDYERRHGYRGPEAIIELPANKELADEAIEKSSRNIPTVTIFWRQWSWMQTGFGQSGTRQWR